MSWLIRRIRWSLNAELSRYCMIPKKKPISEADIWSWSTFGTTIFYGRTLPSLPVSQDLLPFHTSTMHHKKKFKIGIELIKKLFVLKLVQLSGW